MWKNILESPASDNLSVIAFCPLKDFISLIGQK